MRRILLLLTTGLLATALAGCSPPKKDAEPAAPPATAGGPSYALACGAAPFGPDATADDIEAAYGAGALTDELIIEGEGEETPGSVLFSGDPARELRILWIDPDGRSGIFRVYTSGSAWSGPGGVKVGESLPKVEAANGRAFGLAGFQWDYSGAVLNWRGGELAAQDCNFGVRFEPPANAPIQGLLGDNEFASDSAAMRAAAPVVNEISLVYPEGEGGG